MENSEISGLDITTPEMLAATINKQFSKYNALLSMAATAQQVKDIQAKMIVENSEIMGQIKTTGDEMGKMQKEFEKFSDIVKTQGETITKMKTFLNPPEQKKSFKQAVYDQLKQGAFNDFINEKSGRSKMQIELKDVAFTGTYGSGAAQHAYMPFGTPALPDVEDFDVRLIVPVGTIDSEKLDFPQERAASRTNNGAWTTENGETTTNAYGFTLATVNAERYTAHVKVSRRAMRNTSWLASFIQAALLQEFITSLNTGVIAGDGSGNTLNGLLNNANTFAGTGMNNAFKNADYFSVMRAAAAEMKKTYKRKPNHVFLDPIDYAIMSDARTTVGDFISTKFMTSDGMGYDNILGMKKIETADITDGAYLVAEIAPNIVQLLFNGPIEILASDSDDDNFTKNLITLKIEADVMLPIYNTNALLKGTLATDLNTIALT